MQYRNLGNSGLKVSVIGLGANQFGGKVSHKEAAMIIGRALDLGLNFIDTANTYQKGNSEIAIGQAIAQRRDEVVLATKVASKVGEGPNDRGASRAHIMAGVEASLRRLGTDWIDLYQIHRFDESTPIEETMRALDDLVQSGKVRYIGASNYAAWQLCRANDIAECRGWSTFVSIQPHYHMLERGVEAELLPYCKAMGVGVIPYFPLAGGFLTGKYREGEPAPAGSRGEANGYVRRYFTPDNFAKVRELERLAHERGHSMAELAIAWLLSRPQVSTVIAGATSVEQLENNLKAGEWTLSADDAALVDQILSGAAGGE